MRETVFLFREANTDNRDAVAYVEVPQKRLECGHYFPSLNLTGACFSCGFVSWNFQITLDTIEEQYEFMETILTLEEMKQLIVYSNEIGKLKCGIEVGDEEYHKGIKLIDDILPVFNKLRSDEGQELFKKIVEEEKEFLQEEHHLDDEDIDRIFNEYSLPYADRGIVGRVYEDVEEIGEEWLDDVDDCPEHLKRFINLHDYGFYIVDGDSSYITLVDGRVVHLNY